MIRSIQVPLDGSAFAEQALPVAMHIARRLKVRLHLVTVSPPLNEVYLEGLTFSSADLTEEVTARHEKYLASVSKQLRDRGYEVATQVIHGEVVPSLCGLLQRDEDQIAVLATHGRGALGRFWMGSVADELVRQCSKPLLLVRPNDENVDLDRKVNLGRILVPLDGSPLAEQILSPVTELLAGVGAEILLLRAITAILPGGTLPEEAEDLRKEARQILMQLQEMQMRLRREAEEGLRAAAAKLQSKGFRVTPEVMVEDDPARAILREAERHGVDMIALETHGRSGLSRLFRGSVADKVVRGAHVPVLVQTGVDA